MKLIALTDTKVFNSKTGSSRMVKKGEYVGVLTKNNNDGTYLINDNELVDEENVAVMVQDNATIVDKPKNAPVPGSNTTQQAIKWKRIIGVALLGSGIYFFVKGKRGIGITMIVASLLMIKRNFNS